MASRFARISDPPLTSAKNADRYESDPNHPSPLGSLQIGKTRPTRKFPRKFPTPNHHSGQRREGEVGRREGRGCGSEIDMSFVSRPQRRAGVPLCRAHARGHDFAGSRLDDKLSLQLTCDVAVDECHGLPAAQQPAATLLRWPMWRVEPSSSAFACGRRSARVSVGREWAGWGDRLLRDTEQQLLCRCSFLSMRARLFKPRICSCAESYGTFNEMSARSYACDRMS